MSALVESSRHCSRLYFLFWPLLLFLSSDLFVDCADQRLEPESLNHLFTAFYTTEPQGMGMGLAISRSIIEAHGGRLWATANEGPGAVFQFTLPGGGERAGMTEAEAIVFVVDDDEGMRQSLKNLIGHVKA